MAIILGALMASTIKVLVISSLSFLSKTLLGEELHPAPRLNEVMYTNPTLVGNDFKKTSELTSGFTPAWDTTWCGPSRRPYSLECLKIPSGQSELSLPLPGDLTSIPLFVDSYLYLGTNKGVFMKLHKNFITKPQRELGPFGFLPFWGNLGRWSIHSIAQAGSNSETQMPHGSWATRITGEIIGTPVVIQGVVATLSSNQYLYGFDIHSGKTLWTLPVGSSTGLRLENKSLTSIEKNLLVGTSDGQLMIVSPTTGAVIWSTYLESESIDRFPGVSAPPLVYKGEIIASTGDTTLSTNIAHRTPAWSKAIGSISSGLATTNGVVIGSPLGHLYRLSSTGQELWARKVAKDPIAGIFQIHTTWALSVSTQGDLQIINLETGDLIKNHSLFGHVTHVNIWNKTGACLTLSSGSLHCFEAAIK